MTKRVQLAGGTYDIENFFVGFERELRVDTSNDSLRLHDGVKEGGFEFLNRDANDARYQPFSPELLGFNFGAQEKGILTRVGPGLYRVRKIEVDTDGLVITNPRGTAGDFHLALASTIASDHTFSGIITFTQPVQGEAGFVGNLTGDVTGDLTGDSFGTHTGPTLGLHTGGIDTRGATIDMDDDQLPENAVHQLLIDRGVPYGAILMWSGLADAIPESWALCDGSNGTPDLRNRFIVGAGLTYAESQTGGSTTATGTATVAMGGTHSHTVTVEPHALTLDEMPAHKHGTGVTDAGGNCFNHGTLPASPPGNKQFDNNSGAGTVEGYSTTDGGGAAHTHAGSVADVGGAHSHEISLDAVTILPPYFALCYIMKIAPNT